MIYNIIGGELGSHKCMISRLNRNTLESIANEASNLEIPTMVGYSDKDRHFSEACLVKLKRNHNKSIVQLINLMGEYDEKELDFQYVKNVENQNGRYFFPDLKAQKLENQKNKNDNDKMEVEEENGQNITQILGAYAGYIDHLITNKIKGGHYYSVFSVPSYFTAVEKKQVEQAFQIQKFPLAKVIEEHQAVATTYLYQKRKDFREMEITQKDVVFIDIGFSKTSIFAVRFENDIGYVKYIKCVKGLGIRKMDYLMYERLGEVFKQKHGEFPGQNKKVRVRILEALEKHRKILSTNLDTQIDIECLYEENDLNYNFTREEFQKIIQTDILDPLEKLFKEAKMYLDKKKIATDDIEILGGGVRIPIIKEKMLKIFKVEKLGFSMPLESISRGCTLQCAQYTSIFNPLVKMENFQIINCSANAQSFEILVNGEIVKKETLNKFQTLPYDFSNRIDLLGKIDPNSQNFDENDIQVKVYVGENLVNTVALKRKEGQRVLDIQKTESQNNDQKMNQEQKNNDLEIENEKQKEEKMEEEKEDGEEKKQNENQNQEDIKQVEKKIEEEQENKQEEKIPKEEENPENQLEKFYMLRVDFMINDEQIFEIKQVYDIYQYKNADGEIIEYKAQYSYNICTQGECNNMEIQKFQQIESQQKEVDNQITQLNHIRNNFENYIYEHKRTLEDVLKLSISQEEYENLKKIIQEMQHWFDLKGHDDETQYCEFKENQDKLIKAFEPYIQVEQLKNQLMVEIKDANQMKNLKEQYVEGLNLHLRNQDIGDGAGFLGMFKKGAAKIAQHLEKIQIHNKIILDLGNASLSDKGVCEIFKSLKKQKTLKDIQIDLESAEESKLKNNLTVDSLDAMLEFLESQKNTVERFSLCLKKYPEEEFVKLQALLGKLKKVKYLKVEIKKGDVSLETRKQFNEIMSEKIHKFQFTYYNSNGVRENI